MRFSLPSNYSIKSVDESIIVDDEPITDNIIYVKTNSTYIDFRDWLMNGDYNWYINIYKGDLKWTRRLFTKNY